MKKYISYILLFFLIVSVLDLSYGWICTYMRNHGASRIESVRNSHYDILILGSSKAHHNYDTRLLSDSLGLKCFNAGYDGNGVILAYALYNFACESKIPRYVIFDVKQQFDIYYYDGDKDFVRYFSMLKPYYDIPVINSMFYDFSKKDWLILKSGIYRYNSQLVNLVKDYKNNLTEDEHCGFIPAQGVINSDTPEEKDYSLDMCDLKYNYLKKLICACQTAGTKLIVSISPEYLVSSSRDFNPLFKLCKKYKVEVWDDYCSPDFSNERSYFKDHCHLNETGSHLYTLTVLERLKNQINKEEIYE